jgi:hypothetical protein
MTIHGKNGGNVKPLTHCGAIRLHIRAQAEEEPMSMMLRWSEGASRVELDQQAREERLRLEEAHREFTVEPSPEPSRFERVLRLFGAAMFGRDRWDCRIAATPSSGQPPQSISTNGVTRFPRWEMRRAGWARNDVAAARGLAVVCPLTPTAPAVRASVELSRQQAALR